MYMYVGVWISLCVHLCRSECMCVYVGVSVWVTFWYQVKHRINDDCDEVLCIIKYKSSSLSLGLKCQFCTLSAISTYHVVVLHLSQYSTTITCFFPALLWSLIKIYVSSRLIYASTFQIWACSWSNWSQSKFLSSSLNVRHFHAPSEGSLMCSPTQMLPYRSLSLSKYKSKVDKNWTTYFNFWGSLAHLWKVTLTGTQAFWLCVDWDTKVLWNNCTVYR